MRIAFCSFRLGEADGVSVETEKWRAACTSLGHETFRVAGHIPAHVAAAEDVVIEALGYSATAAVPADVGPLDLRRIETALAPADVVVVENMFGLPLNVPATRALVEVLGERRVVGHHHDLPSQRPRWSSLDPAEAALFPPDRLRWRHVVINELSRRELSGRGIEAKVVRNTFDPHPAPGAGAKYLRRKLDAPADVLLSLQPTRIIPRKNIGLSIAWCEELRRLSGREVVLCITGPCEDGYGDELARLMGSASIRVAHVPSWFGGSGPFTMADAYGACDVVVFPSDWEGFGNPVMESVAHHRPLVVTPYPVLKELLGLGFHFPLLDAQDLRSSVGAVMRTTDADLARNHEVLSRTLPPAVLREQLRQLLRAFD